MLDGDGKCNWCGNNGAEHGCPDCGKVGDLGFVCKPHQTSKNIKNSTVKFTKEELNIVFLTITGMLYPETGITEDLKGSHKKQLRKTLVKLDKILESMDENETSRELN